MTTTTFIQAAPDQYQIMLNNYASIVEKTNQQMSYWFDPYVIIITCLTALFTLGAIVATILIFRSSREYKKQVEDFFEAQKKMVDENIERVNNQFKDREERANKYESTLNDLIKEYTDKLSKAGTENKEDIQRLEKTIDELNKSKASLGSYAVPEAVDVSLFLFGTQIKMTKCLKCEKKFQYKDREDNSITIVPSSFGKKKSVHCPYCGFENFL